LNEYRAATQRKSLTRADTLPLIQAPSRPDMMKINKLMLRTVPKVWAKSKPDLREPSGRFA
jgi:hypothetical protein